jgi:hypothetical protein
MVADVGRGIGAFVDVPPDSNCQRVHCVGHTFNFMGIGQRIYGKMQATFVWHLIIHFPFTYTAGCPGCFSALERNWASAEDGIF